MVKSKNVTICGAGLVGSLLALILQQRGFNVTVYERYLDIRAIPSLGRSINLVLTSRGLRACNILGPKLLQGILDLCVPVTGRILHQLGGEVQFQRYGKDDSEKNFSISRFELNKYLINQAEKAGAKMYFNHKVTKYDLEKGELHIEETHGENKPVTHQVVQVESVIGADGVGSPIRYAMRDSGYTSFRENLLTHGYKEMIFPKANCGSLAQHGLHIWPRGGHMLMGLANLDGSMTGTIYLAKEGPDSFKELNTKEKVAAFFNQYYKDAIPLLGGMEMLTKEFLGNPLGILGTVRTSSYNAGGKAMIIGDAAHAMVPFFGQGTNCGFEDCLSFAQMLDKHDTWDTLFAEFDQERRPNGHAMCDMALDNFIEMAARVADPEFLLQKKVETIFENRWPGIYRSRYAMVCYGGNGNVTYSNAQKLGGINYAILAEVVKGLKRPEDVDLKKAYALIQSKLVPAQRRLKADVSTVSMDLNSTTSSRL